MKTLLRTRPVLFICLLLALGLLAGCALTMAEQPRYAPFAQSNFFADQASARPLVADTVARSSVPVDSHLTTGRVNNEFVDTFPFTVTLATLERGQERYDIFCAPCHGLVGNGDGVIIDYGMRAPTSFHDPDLRAETAGYYFSIISDGTRIMPSYAARVPPDDRWAIIAYIRALQLSQNANTAALPADLLPEIEASEPITN